MPPSILNYYPEELRTLLAQYGEKPYRADQLYAWLHEKAAVSYAEMTNLPKALREHLEQDYPLHPLRIVKELRSRKDGTRKYLFALEDGNVIESVRMPYEHGISVCVSSQVGCRMGCRFCASTLDGLVRSLTAAEMLGQVYGIRREGEERVSHVVIMGSGEPLENYENTVRFIRQLSHPQGAQISQRNMPVANRYALRELIPACQVYFQKTGRRLTFEYALIENENDTPEDAAELAALLKGLHAHVNLIPVNAVKERNLRRPDASRVMKFQKKLEKYGINVTIRREMGADISGACGQLRKSYISTDQENRE